MKAAYAAFAPATRLSSRRSRLKSIHWIDLSGLRPAAVHPAIRAARLPIVEALRAS
jgi:hypothetical protein